MAKGASIKQIVGRAVPEHLYALEGIVAGKPPEASERIIQTLRRWGCIEAGHITERGSSILEALQRKEW